MRPVRRFDACGDVQALVTMGLATRAPASSARARMANRTAQCTPRAYTTAGVALWIADAAGRRTPWASDYRAARQPQDARADARVGATQQRQRGVG